MPILEFLDDKFLIQNLALLHQTYKKCKQDMTLNQFYKNKIDPIKFNLDMTFNNLSFDENINLEITRQNDKTISNAIGNFHQTLMGGIDGFEDLGHGGGCDIRKLDNTIFAEVKNKHNTMNSSSQKTTFIKLADFADNHPGSTCYLVEVIATQSQDILWEGTFNGKYYSHPSVRRISADKFYELMTGKPYAFRQICIAIKGVSKFIMDEDAKSNNMTSSDSNILSTIKRYAEMNKIDCVDQIMRDNYTNYNGF